jgi:hypothetical protein
MGIKPLIGVFLVTFVVGVTLMVFWDTKKSEPVGTEPAKPATDDGLEKNGTGAPGSPLPVDQAGLAAKDEVYTPESRNPHTMDNAEPTDRDLSADDTSVTENDGNNGGNPAFQVKTPAKAPPMDRETAEMLARVPKNMIPPQKLVDSSWLTLQDISWSSNPSERIAVINSQITKEGRRVSGGLVVRIDRDYVVIEKDGEQLLLPFNHH